jgi:hypothetical protein
VTRSCLASTFTMATQARVGAYVSSSTPCAASGTATPVAPTWGSSRKFCKVRSVGAGCPATYVCVPAAPNHCVLAAGARTCPALYARDGGSWYTGFSDNRACSACACGSQTPGSCTALRAQFYGGATADCTAAVNVASSSNTKICNIAANCPSAGFGGTPSPPSCPAVTALTGGAATATGEQTLCCVP